MIKEKLKKLFYRVINNSLFSYISRGHKNNGIILCYHRVLPENMIDSNNYPDKSLITSLENFEKHLEYFSKNYELVSLDEIITIKDEGRFKICITFDDGYKDNLDYVLPLIKKYNIPITIFITTRFLENDVFLWWYELWEYIQSQKKIIFNYNKKEFLFKLNSYKDKINCYNALSLLFLNEDSVNNQKKLLKNIGQNNPNFNFNSLFIKRKNLIELKRDPLVTIGCHSHNHIRFSKLSDKLTRSEIEISTKILEKNTNIKIEHFAYPYGQLEDLAIDNLDILKSFNFKSISTAINRNIDFNNTDLINLPRYGISNQDDLNSIMCKINGSHSFIMSNFNAYQ